MSLIASLLLDPRLAGFHTSAHKKLQDADKLVCLTQQTLSPRGEWVHWWWGGWPTSHTFREFSLNKKAWRLRTKITSGIHPLTKRIFFILINITLIASVMSYFEIEYFDNFIRYLARWIDPYFDAIASLGKLAPQWWLPPAIIPPLLITEYFALMRPIWRHIKTNDMTILQMVIRFSWIESRMNLVYTGLRSVGLSWIILYALGNVIQMHISYTNVKFISYALIGVTTLLSLVPIQFMKAKRIRSKLLAREGFYKYSRNPIYLSQRINDALLLILAIYFQGWSFLGFMSMVWVVNSRLIRWEEGRLLLLHGEPYLLYFQKTPRWLGRPRAAA